METETAASARVLAGRYRLGPLIGRGGMAEVHDGHDRRLDRPVAVKLLRPDMAADPALRRRFEIEARAAARLAHPNVVTVFDTGDDDGTAFIVMERLPGETLADRMAAGAVDEEWLRRVAGDVLAALASAHAAGIVHRDVKPGNILIAADGCAKVADFGIAKSGEAASGVATATGLLLGTPAYLAPERLEGHPATPRSDLYSLGVVLYEALAGVKPFTGGTAVAVAQSVQHDEPTPLEELRPHVAPDLAHAVRWAMAKDPARRPRTAEEMAAALARGAPAAVVADGGVGAGTGGTDATRPVDATVVAPGGRGRRQAAGRPRSAHGLPAALGAVVAAVSAAPGAARSWWRSRPSRVRVPGSRRPPAAAAGVVAVALVALLLLVGGGLGEGPAGGFDRADLAGRLRSLAADVGRDDGRMGPEASDRLEEVADQVLAEGGSDAATTLLRDVADWNRNGLLSGPATVKITDVLAELPGVDAAVVVPTTLPTTTSVAEAAEEDEDKGKDEAKDDDEDEDGPGRGKGRKKKD